MKTYDFDDCVEVQGTDVVVKLTSEDVEEFWDEVSLYPCLERVKSKPGSRIVRIPRDEALMILDAPGYPRHFSML